MKKLFFVVFAAALFLSCQQGFDDVHFTVVNNTGSNLTVSFHGETIPLADNESADRTINSAERVRPPEIVLPDRHPRSRRMETTGASTSSLTYIFSTVDPIPLIIENTLALTVTISAGDYLALNGNALDPLHYLSVPANGTTAAVIYTETPRFSINLPGAVVNWGITEYTMNVTIHGGN